MFEFATYLAQHPIAELAFIITVLLVVGYIMQLLRQPSIVGYILAGIILSPQLYAVISNQEGIELFAQIGISLLLFLVGLGLSLRVIKEVGKVAVVGGLGQIVFTSIVGFGICVLLGIDPITSIFLAIGLTFSSTIIIVKLISDRSDTNTLYGKISFGILIVQDFVAMLILIAFAFMGTLQQGGGNEFIIQTVLSIVIAIVLVWLFTKFVLYRLVNIFSESQEYLLLFSVGWAILLAATFEYVGLTMEAGALIAGITLADSSKKFLIIGKIKPMRDFFIALFFVYIGGKLVFDNMAGIWSHIVVLSLFVLIGNPLIVFFLMKKLRYDWKTSFMTGLTVAQISEFSFIVIGVGLSLGLVKSSTLLTTITFIGLITMTGSSYLFYYAESIMARLEKKYPFLKKQNISHNTMADDYDVIIVGYGPHGKKLCHLLSQEYKILVLEYDPHVVEHTRTPENVTLLQADATQDEIRNELAQYNTDLVIVTSSQMETNVATYHFNKKLDRYVIGHADNEFDAEVLYKEGFDIVYVSHEGAVSKTLSIIQDHADEHHIQQMRQTHIEILETYLRN